MSLLIGFMAVVVASVGIFVATLGLCGLFLLGGISG